MSTAPRLAALTMVRDERVMLPRWIAHYGRECGADNLFVIDDNTTDGSTDGLPGSVIRIPSWGDKHFETTRMKLVSSIAAGLLEAYDAVLFADADEFLVADPERYDGLVDLVAARAEVDVLAAQALNVVHDAGREGALDPDQPVLGQRQWAKFIPLMCKPAIKRTPAPWVAGSHGTTIPFEIDPDLYMFHLKFAEREHLRATGDHRKALADAEGRAAETAWQFAGDDLVELLDEVVRDVDPAAVEPYKTRKKVLADIVRQGDGGNYRAHGRRQFNAMRGQPMVSVPERFHGTRLKAWEAACALCYDFGVRRTCLTVLVLLLGFVLSGCGDDTAAEPGAGPEPTSTSSGTTTPAPDGPTCEEVWVDGSDLPRGYEGCVEGSAWVAADSRRCESGQVIVIYADRYYGAKGAVVNDMGGSLEENKQYQRALRSCG